MFGGGSKTRSFVSLLALIGLTISTIMTMLGIMKESHSTDPNTAWAPEYVIPGSIFNALTVLFLLYLISTASGKTNLYKLVVIFLLVAGLAAEIYMTTLLNMTNLGEDIGTWIVVVLNWLFRAFFILEYVQEEWSPLFPSAKDLAKAVSGPAASSSSSSSSSSSGSPDVKKELRDRLKAYKDKLKQALVDRDVKDASGVAVKVVGPTINDAEVFINKLADPKLSDLDAAKKLIKLSDGRLGTAVLAGGRR